MCSFIVFFVAFAISAASADSPTGSELELRQHLVSFFQRGGDTEALPATHPLRPLARLPLTATMSYMLLGEDEGMLSRFYPEISRIVYDRLDQDNLTDTGLLPGSAIAGDASEIYLSPTLNALACLELYCLHLLAFRIGEYEDSFELLSWSTRMAETTTQSFYDPSRNFFFPQSNDGYLRIRYDAGQVLPLLLDNTIGSGARNRIAEKIRNPEIGARLWEKSADDAVQPVVASLLRSVPDGWGAGAAGDDRQRSRRPEHQRRVRLGARFWPPSNDGRRGELGRRLAL